MIRGVESQAYVFARSPEGKPVLAGTIRITRRGGEFVYAEPWMNAPWAYPLDPINLPLSRQVFVTTHRNNIFGVFWDAAPDAWGERVQLMAHKSLPRNELEKLIRLSGTGVGMIEFSLSQSRPKTPLPLPGIQLLDQLSQAVNQIASNHSLSEDELRLIEPGSSMGGARPKITLTDEDGVAWLTKFSRADDVVSYPEIEFAAMSLLAKTGVRVPEVKLRKISDGKYCYLIRRFDRVPGADIHFISAHALFNIDRLRIYADSRNDPASYIALARIMRKVSSAPLEDCIELFKRMVYSICIGGTDDHARNHALLFNVATEQWRLSPAYDVLPIVNNQGQQSMGVGLFGRDSTLENALSAAADFGIKPVESVVILKDILATLATWREHFIAAGVGAGDIMVLSRIIDHNLELARAYLQSIVAS
jgi:serine/threonine-protein kinase HipA